jgi:hypothetical protein
MIVRSSSPEITSWAEVKSRTAFASGLVFLREVRRREV